MGLERKQGRYKLYEKYYSKLVSGNIFPELRKLLCIKHAFRARLKFFSRLKQPTPAILAEEGKCHKTQREEKRSDY